MSQTSNNIATPFFNQTQYHGDRTMGPWTLNENILYISFLQKNKAIMSSKKKRKQTRIFDKMAEFMRTRNSLQCRSHHQKLLEKMGDSKIIIKNFKKNVGKRYYKEQYRECILRREENIDHFDHLNDNPNQENASSPQIQKQGPLFNAPLNNVQQYYPFANYLFFSGIGQPTLGNLVIPLFMGPY